MARYKDAVEWIALNDNEGDDEDVEALAYYISVALVSDLFARPADQVARDVYRRRHRDSAVGLSWIRKPNGDDVYSPCGRFLLTDGEVSPILLRSRGYVLRDVRGGRYRLRTLKEVREILRELAAEREP